MFDFGIFLSAITEGQRIHTTLESITRTEVPHTVSGIVLFTLSQYKV